MRSITEDRPQPYRTTFDSRPPMLELRPQTGERTALAYCHAVQFTMQAPGHLELLFTAHQVTIEGRNLDHLYEDLLHLRVVYIQCLETAEERTAIDRIAVTAIG